MLVNLLMVGSVFLQLEVDKFVFKWMLFHLKLLFTLIITLLNKSYCFLPQIITGRLHNQGFRNVYSKMDVARLLQFI